MKAYFDSQGILCIDSESNTDRMALKEWNRNGFFPRIRTEAHLKADETDS